MKTFLGTIVLITLFTISVVFSEGGAAQLFVGQKGAYCWTPVTTYMDGTVATSIGYELDVIQPNGTVYHSNPGIAGQPTQLPCPSGKIGVDRDLSTPINGDYSVTVTAYNLTGVRSVPSDPTYFTVGTPTPTTIPAPKTLPKPGAVEVK